jgi:ABC-type transport system involved in multi-copper enzyme maturation permease subunit
VNEIVTIALNTYKEAVRNKVFYIILVFGLCLLAVSLILASLALGADDRIIKQIGLAAINFFGILLTVFVGVNLVYDELNNRTIYTIIAAGVTRNQFLMGKFLGLFLTIVINVLIMAFLLCLLIWFWPQSVVTPSLILAVYLMLFEFMIISAFAILFSSFSTPVLSAVLTVMCWVIGRMSEDLLEWSRQLFEDGAVFIANLLMVIYYVVPNLAIFNIQNQVVYREDIGAIGYAFLLYPFFAIGYAGILLVLATFSFARRDFK